MQVRLLAREISRADRVAAQPYQAYETRAGHQSRLQASLGEANQEAWTAGTHGRVGARDELKVSLVEGFAGVRGKTVAPKDGVV